MVTEWGAKNGFNPFSTSTIIASTCMLTFQVNYLQPETMQITPNAGFGARKNQNEVGTKLVLYIQEEFGLDPENCWHVSTKRGEKKIGNYYVDGFMYDDVSNIDYIIEFDGSYWQGSPIYDPETRLANNKTNRELMEETELRLQYLRNLQII